MLTVTEIEDGILATLQADATLAGYCKAFLPIPTLDEASLRKLVMQFPSIGVIGNEGAYDYQLSSVAEDAGTFLVLCFNRSLRSRTASSRGSGEEPGVWDLVEDARRILTGSTLGLAGVVDALPVRRNLLFAGDQWAAAALEVEVRWRS